MQKLLYLLLNGNNHALGVFDSEKEAVDTAVAANIINYTVRTILYFPKKG